MHELSYVPGSGVLIAGPSSFVVVDAPWEHEQLMRVWAAVDAEGSLSDVLDAVTGGRFSDLATFVVCVRDAASGGARIILRPEVAVTVYAMDGAAHSLTTAGVELWAEHTLPLGASLEVVLPTGGADDASSFYPFRHGITRAGSVTWGAPARVVVPDSAGAHMVESADAPRPPVRDVEPLEPAPVESGPADVLLAAPEAETGDEPRPVLDEAASRTLVESLTITTVEDEPASSAGREDVVQPVSVASSVEADPYDTLFGATVFRSVADAAVRLDHEASHSAGDDREPHDVEPVAGTAGESPATPPSAPSEPPPTGLRAEQAVDPLDTDLVAPQHAASTGMIDSVPFAAPTSSPVPSPIADDGDHDGLTMTVGSLRAMRAQEAAASAPPLSDAKVPLVHAITCASGHANPPQSAACRVCGLPLAFQDPITVPRPSLGVLVFAGGREVALDRVVLVGRAPMVERVSPEDVPNVVKLDSPTKDLSRNHVEIRLEGWHVLVVDLGSTNGTVVQMPGRRAERVHPHEPYAIVPGTVVTLGEEQSFTYEVRG